MKLKVKCRCGRRLILTETWIKQVGTPQKSRIYFVVICTRCVKIRWISLNTAIKNNIGIPNKHIKYQQERLAFEREYEKLRPSYDDTIMYPNKWWENVYNPWYSDMKSKYPLLFKRNPDHKEAPRVRS